MAYTDDTLSRRAAKIVSDLDIPWRFAPRSSYDPVTNPNGLISFATAENSLLGQELEEFCRSKVSVPAVSFKYAYSTAGGQSLPRILAAHLNELFHPWKELDGSEVAVTNAATAMHAVLGWAVADPGDGILTTSPVYGRFELDFGNLGQLRMVYADMGDNPAASFEDGVVDKLEETLKASNEAGVKIRALLIINPHNPLGRCYPRSTLVALMRFCQRYRIHLISDEVYGCTVFNAAHPELPDFTSALSIDPSGILDIELLHVTYGLSKDFCAAGLRIGAVVTRSPAIRRAIRSVVRFFNPSGPAVAVASTMLADRAWCHEFLATVRARVKEMYDFFTERLDKLGVAYLEANAGLFVYVDLSPWLRADVEDPEFELAQRLLDAGVFLHPKEEHGRPGWFRMVYTQDPNMVHVGLERLAKVLRSQNNGLVGTFVDNCPTGTCR